MNKLPLTIALIICSSFAFSQKSKDIKVTQFEDCQSIKGVDLDSLRKKNTEDLSITLIILRAESTHSDGTKTISPLDSFIVPYDTSLIHIYSYELKYTKGSSSCEFNYTLNGRSDNVTKGNPPFLCLTTKNDSLLKYLKRALNLNYFSKSNKYLLLSESYNKDKGFYKQLNRILNSYDQTFINTYEIKSLKKEIKYGSGGKKFISVLYSPASVNQVSESGMKSGSVYMTNLNLSSIQINYNRYFKDEKGCGFHLGAVYSKFNASLGNIYPEILIDTLERNAVDKDGDKYTLIAYGKGIEESISITFFGFMAGLSYKIPFNSGNSIMNIAFNPGIKISQALSASYHATKGTVSWSGYYPQYDSSNNLFGENYGFYKDQPVYKETKRLEMNNTFVSGYLSADWDIALGRSGCFFKTSLYGEAGTNILNPNQKERVLPYTNGDHNSLAYRSDKMNINSWGLKFGFSYAF